MAKKAVNGKAASSRQTGGERGYPRPQLERSVWENLNGTWEFAIDADATLVSPADVDFDQSIVVPFAPETPLSGINDQGFYKAVWYRRQITVPRTANGHRVILHFGAVDWSARVWVNDQLVATHEGGYTPFQVDITDQLTGSTTATVVVRAEDDPLDLAKPRGKQDWHAQPHGIWYPRTTGIWQTVWLEVVPSTYIRKLKWTPSFENWNFKLCCELAGAPISDSRLRVRLSHADKTLVDDTYSFTDIECTRTINLPDPGIDDARNDLLWFPHNPKLIDATIELLDADGAVLDTVKSYTAMRSVQCEGQHFILNNRQLVLRLVLDQGYWADGGLTAPNDAALKRDAELVKQLGFNGLRKHQKIEDPRFLYWCDKLGVLVWEEMPSPYRFAPQTVRRLSQTWQEAIERDASHPCIIAWVPFNESWGVPDLTDQKDQRDFVKGIYYLTKSLDPTRPVIGNDGWELVISDIVGIHDYERVPPTLLERYAFNDDAMNKLFFHERPGHRQLVIDDMDPAGKPIMLTEFGGIAFSKDTKGTWGYKRAGTQAEFQKQYTELLAAVRAVPLFSGFCYTQFTDTYQEANGLLYMDRTPKFRIEEIKKATGG